MWLRSSTIYLDGYGSKIRKVSGCRPTVSNETILATKQEFFFTKVAPVQSMTDIVPLGFWLLLLPLNVCFILHYHFRKEFFLNIYISVNTIFECSYLFFGWEIGHPLSTYATGGMEGVGHPKCVQVRTRREGYHAYHEGYHIFILWCLVLFVGVSVRNGSISVVMK